LKGALPLHAPLACPAGKPQAITATAHKLARIWHNMMRYGVAYLQQTEADYAKQVHERSEKQLGRQAKELGYELTPITPPTPAA
jgi:hypothetical protein